MGPPRKLLCSATNIPRFKHINPTGSNIEMWGAATLTGASAVVAFFPFWLSHTNPKLHKTPRKHQDTGVRSKSRNLLKGCMDNSFCEIPIVEATEKNMAVKIKNRNSMSRIGNSVTDVTLILTLCGHVKPHRSFVIAFTITFHHNKHNNNKNMGEKQ